MTAFVPMRESKIDPVELLRNNLRNAHIYGRKMTTREERSIQYYKTYFDILLS
jgi:hypothetical protein